ncbi:cinnamoyl-CoA reductase 2-like isoform X1 [Vitis riparia]|uniref:cinnamoyl-CoA reductase 2-like isoform X1 n=1 Tax=Vitis riparia TaxID=96939 RepID=UPI00155A4CF2|nr:cinnamoyl-CoA reductase 2-like isoform X1 [Vitis riparia]XP_034676955.1 cinnamoyl-CoA reductase 2-like isoform X1 [Vitis riparia]XP_034676956.1 cinnamoyl-CoA reductase 2-like isoform X1 [Vitis riparia]
MLKSACRCISNFAAYSPRHHHRKKRDWRGEKVWSDLIMAEKGKVCVTGAGGYVASWVVKLLLSKGYIVHGTVREPSDGKYSHLKKLEKASENLKLFKADLLEYNTLCSAIAGCDGVFHVASPVPPTTVVPNPEVELMEPAVKGTLNVLKACTEAKVKRVVVVSSGSAVMRNPRWPKGKVKDETCWSDKEYCRTTENWYCLSKTEAETEALEYAKKSGLDVVRVCPTLVLGPILQSTINASSLVLIKLLKEGYESLENKHRMIVDARDVAEALLLAYEQPEAEGRYICTAHMIKMQDLVENLRSIYPYYNYPKNFTEGEETENLSSEKLQRLGWNYRPLEETLVDSIKSYKEAGILD